MLAMVLLLPKVSHSNEETVCSANEFGQHIGRQVRRGMPREQVLANTLNLHVFSVCLVASQKFDQCQVRRNVRGVRNLRGVRKDDEVVDGGDAVVVVVSTGVKGSFVDANVAVVVAEAGSVNVIVVVVNAGSINVVVVVVAEASSINVVVVDANAAAVVVEGSVVVEWRRRAGGIGNKRSEVASMRQVGGDKVT